MYLSEAEKIAYLANVAHVANKHGSVPAKKSAALEEVRAALGAKKSALEAALKKASAKDFQPIRVESYSAQVSNLADMLFVSIIDGELSDSEKEVIRGFAAEISLTEEQSTLLTREAINRAKKNDLPSACPSCKAMVANDAVYCPKCGISLTGVQPVQTDEFEIPKSGYSIEFCESTSARFPDALKIAQTAPDFSSIIRNKKTWYLASWPTAEFGAVIKLASALGGIRNKKCHLNGIETPWDELFGFVWCAEERGNAYRPAEYCFGKGDNQLNPWGCIHAHMTWTEWSKWFSYGHFENTGVFKGRRVWIFDKDRIDHELKTNLHRYRYCPFLRANLIRSVLRALPDRVEVIDGSDWKYGHSYEEVPGSIKIVEVEKSDGMEFRQEYFADGVRPKSLSVLGDILKKSFAEAGITDITATQLLK